VARTSKTTMTPFYALYGSEVNLGHFSFAYDTLEEYDELTHYKSASPKYLSELYEQNLYHIHLYNPTRGENRYNISISDPHFRDYANSNPNTQLGFAQDPIVLLSDVDIEEVQPILIKKKKKKKIKW
jgi:hypothetical protein